MTRREPTHAEHMATLASYVARGGALWAGPTDREIAETWRGSSLPKRARCSLCRWPLDSVLTDASLDMHPSCEFPETRIARPRP